MGKQKTPRALANNEACAIWRNARTSPYKLNLVAASIRGLSAQDALAELTFSPKRIAGGVKKTVESAVANAENNHQLDIDSLYVKEAYVGKSFVMKRFRPRARGRVGKILKPFSHLTVVVAERAAEEAKPAKAEKKTAKTSKPAEKQAAKNKEETA